MMGKNHKGSLLVMTDRASLFTRIRKMHSKNADQMAEGWRNSLRINTNWKHSLLIMLAFSKHELIAQSLDVDAYFTRPYLVRIKGQLKIGLGFRRFYPKKTDIRFVTEEQTVVENKINERPVRKFNYLNAKQCYKGKLHLLLELTFILPSSRLINQKFMYIEHPSPNTEVHKSTFPACSRRLIQCTIFRTTSALPAQLIFRNFLPDGRMFFWITNF